LARLGMAAYKPQKPPRTTARNGSD